MNDTSNALLYLAVIVGIVQLVVCYAKALKEVKAGGLAIYRDRGDFEEGNSPRQYAEGRQHG